MVAVLSKAGDHVPVIPLLEVVGNADKLAPEQIEFTCVNIGNVDEPTEIVIFAIVAHSPVVGVKLYVVVAVLSKAGDHVPVIPLFEVVGNADKVTPEQIEFTCVKVGVGFGVTEIVIFAIVAHSPAVGVNTYAVVAVMSIAGNQVPVIPLFEVVGNGDKVTPEQIEFTCVNVGVGFGVTEIVIDAVVAH